MIDPLSDKSTVADLIDPPKCTLTYDELVARNKFLETELAREENALKDISKIVRRNFLDGKNSEALDESPSNSRPSVSSQANLARALNEYISEHNAFNKFRLNMANLVRNHCSETEKILANGATLEKVQHKVAVSCQTLRWGTMQALNEVDSSFDQDFWEPNKTKRGREEEEEEENVGETKSADEEPAPKESRTM